VGTTAPGGPGELARLLLIPVSRRWQISQRLQSVLAPQIKNCGALLRWTAGGGGPHVFFDWRRTAKYQNPYSLHRIDPQHACPYS